MLRAPARRFQPIHLMEQAKMVIPHGSTEPSRPQPAFPPILYSIRQVAVMVRIAAHDSMDHLSKLTGTPPAELALIATGEREPSAGVLAAFELQPAEGGYQWNVR